MLSIFPTPSPSDDVAFHATLLLHCCLTVGLGENWGWGKALISKNKATPSFAVMSRFRHDAFFSPPDCLISAAYDATPMPRHDVRRRAMLIVIFRLAAAATLLAV